MSQQKILPMAIWQGSFLFRNLPDFSKDDVSLTIIVQNILISNEKMNGKTHLYKNPFSGTKFSRTS